MQNGERSFVETSTKHRAGTQKHQSTDRGVSKQTIESHPTVGKAKHYRIIATVCWQRNKRKKNIGAVSCTPESEETLPPKSPGERDRRGRHSLSRAVRRRYQSGLRQVGRSAALCTANMAAAAGLSRRCTVRGQVELSPSGSNRLRPVLVIARSLAATDWVSLVPTCQR